jgi:hypothetical protein
MMNMHFRTVLSYQVLTIHLCSSNFCLKANPDPGIKLKLRSFNGSKWSLGGLRTPTMEAQRIKVKP